MVVLISGLAVLTGCQALQTTKQPMPFTPRLTSIPSATHTPKIPKENEPLDNESFFLLERWF